jgi:hypothetical protein
VTRWLAHLLGIEASIEPLTELRGMQNSPGMSGWIRMRLKWRRPPLARRGLDEETNGRVLGIYRLTFADPALMLEEVGRESVYLIMAMSPQKLVRLKPQNLLTGLPIRHLEAAT